MKSGDTAALFALAGRLARLGGVRLGAQSKAQRGYQLAGLGKPLARQALINDKAMSDTAAIGEGLRHWQHHEQLWLESRGNNEVQQQAFTALCEGVALIERRATGVTAPWRHQLISLQAHLAREERQNDHWPADLSALFLHPDYVALQLAIAAWLHQTAR